MRKRKPDDEFDPIRGFMLAAPSGDGDLGFWPLGRTAVKRLVLISLCILVVAPAEAQRDRYHYLIPATMCRLCSPLWSAQQSVSGLSRLSVIYSPTAAPSPRWAESRSAASRSRQICSTSICLRPKAMNNTLLQSLPELTPAAPSRYLVRASASSFAELAATGELPDRIPNKETPIVRRGWGAIKRDKNAVQTAPSIHGYPPTQEPAPAAGLHGSLDTEEQERSLPALSGEAAHRNFIIVTFVIVSCISGTAVAQEHKAKAVTPEALQWAPAPPVLPKGGQMAVLAGDPGKKGQFFVVRLKAPAGYKIPAHQHPTAEAVTVISGDLHYGMGDKLDESKAKKLVRVASLICLRI